MFDLGFVSAIFGEKTFEEVIDFAATHHFRCVELMCWPRGAAERRYAGVTHIDADQLDGAAVEMIQAYLHQKNVYISALGYYPNPLDSDPEKRDFYQSHLKKVIHAAFLLQVPVVNTFIGRDPHKTLQDNMELFKEHWPPIVAYASALNIKIGIENCPMLFTNDEWPGGKNMAISPDIWEQLFDFLPDSHFGLNFDPSHLLWQQIDYLQPLQEFKDKLFHIHLKDATIYKDRLQRSGILATPLTFHEPRLPGRGDMDWERFFTDLKESGYNGPVVIEFEDKAFEDSPENLTKGLLQARDYMTQFIK